MKRALRYLLIFIAAVILLGVIVSYVSYNTYWPDDPDVAVDSTFLAYYHETYIDSREAFLQRVDRIFNEYDSVETGRMRVPSNIDDDLTIDWCYIPARRANDKLLIINSGLHGIEGYTGSAIQAMFMDQILEPDQVETMGILLLHALNPYGFKYHRKVTENNVDLNRNCVIDTAFNIPNAGYGELKELLMPTRPVNLNSLGNRFFYVKAIAKIAQESMPVLRQAALQGQYDYEQGFYYGGEDYEPQITALQPLLKEKISQYNVVLNLDLHTAYGARAKLHLFIDKPDDAHVLDGIETIFDDVEIDWGSGDDFYTINGEYVVWANNLVPDVLCIPMLFEFGTMDSQKTFGSLKSIQIMIVENQGAHHGYRNARSRECTLELFDEMYYPSSPVWRSLVMSQAHDMMERMMVNFHSLEQAEAAD